MHPHVFFWYMHICMAPISLSPVDGARVYLNNRVRMQLGACKAEIRKVWSCVISFHQLVCMCGYEGNTRMKWKKKKKKRNSQYKTKQHKSFFGCEPLPISVNNRDKRVRTSSTCKDSPFTLWEKFYSIYVGYIFPPASTLIVFFSTSVVISAFSAEGCPWKTKTCMWQSSMMQGDCSAKQ